MTSCKTIIDGVVMEGTCKGILKHGKFVGYYPSGVLAWEVHYKNNMLHGRFRHFYANGNPHFIGFYKHGILHGDFVQYASDNVSLKTTFKRGVLHNWLYVVTQKKKIQTLRYYYGKLIAQEYFD
ncbi:hypothetical protein NHP164001_07860 [Helicobacter trogontum]